MTKGKYAERAKTKRSADGATAVAIGEQNRLRAHIRSLEHLEVENAELRRTLDDLRTQVSARSTPRELKLATELALTEQALLKSHEAGCYMYGVWEEMWRDLHDVFEKQPRTPAVLEAHREALGLLLGWEEDVLAKKEFADLFGKGIYLRGKGGRGTRRAAALKAKKGKAYLEDVQKVRNFYLKSNENPIIRMKNRLGRGASVSAQPEGGESA